MTRTFRWPVRLKYALLAAGSGWLAGWAVAIPFELSLAMRYVDGNARLLPVSLAKGLVVWGGFSLFIALVGFVPLMLPAVLLVSPAWLVKWRYLLIPGVPLVAMLAIYKRMGLLHTYYFRHRRGLGEFFFTAPNFFVIMFALVTVCVYLALARRRLARGDSGTREM